MEEEKEDCGSRSKGLGTGTVILKSTIQWLDLEWERVATNESSLPLTFLSL